MNINYDALKELSETENKKEIISDTEQAKQKLSEVLAELKLMNKPADIKISSEKNISIDNAIKKIKNVAEALDEIDNAGKLKQQQQIKKTTLDDVCNRLNVIYGVVTSLYENMSDLHHNLNDIISDIETIYKYLEKLSDTERENAVSDIMNLLFTKYPLSK